MINKKKYKKNKINKSILIFKINNKIKLNIFILDLFSTYKGLKHLLKLPVNGQRTRSNKKTVFINNLILQKLKLYKFKNSNYTELFVLKKKELLLQLKFLWFYNWKRQYNNVVNKIICNYFYLSIFFFLFFFF